MIEIIWLEDPTKYQYLRETILSLRSPRQIPLKRNLFSDQYKIVGYEIFTKHIPHPLYNRRIWWLKTYDRDADPAGVYRDDCPSEAVIPSSISVDKKSVSYMAYMRGGRKV